MINLRIILPALSAFAITGTAMASHLTPSQAYARVDGDSGSTAMKLKKARNLRHTQTIGDLYVFKSSTGFMILPDDDRAPALLAFSDNDTFDAEGNPALQGWLDFYNKELEQLRRSTAAAPVKAQRRETRVEIEPLLKTEWNQEAPYNMLCPKVNGHDVVTGCVATAMAQFMKYYNYPAEGKGRHSYYWAVGGDTLSMDYDTIPFQWDKMTDIYNDASTEEAKQAVAQLMVACGISVNMHYDIGDSGAATTLMGEALIDIFQYSPSLWMAHRDYYGYNEWIGMIYDELAQGHPVLYSGQGTAGGHQFLCDGYKSDGYFHFNWGWGGLSNGYFLLTALNPDDLGVGGGAGGFNSDQIATLSAFPAQSGDEPTYIMYNSGGFTPAVTTVKAGDDLRCDGIYFNYSMKTLPQGAVLGMKFVNATTKAAEYVRGPEVAGIRLDEGRYYDIIKFPDLADGTYYITPALYAGDKWTQVRTPLGSPAQITATVSDGTATLTAESDASITVHDIEVPATIYASHDFPMEFEATNGGNLEYYANITPYMLDSTGTAVASSGYRPMDVLPGATENVTDYVGNFTALSGQTLSPGNYQLVFRNSAGTDISSPVTVHVDTTTAATKIKIADFHLAQSEPVTSTTAVPFAFTLTCEEGVYYNCPHILVFPGDGGYDVANFTGDDHYLATGESALFTVNGDLDKLDDGWYMAGVYADGGLVSDYIRFRILRSATGIENHRTTEEPDGEIFTLSGVPCHGTLSPGWYIIGGRTTLIR